MRKFSNERTTSGFSGPALKRGANGKLDSRLSDDINLRNRKRGSLKVVHGCNDLAKAD